MSEEVSGILSLVHQILEYGDTLARRSLNSWVFLMMSFMVVLLSDFVALDDAISGGGNQAASRHRFPPLRRYSRQSPLAMTFAPSGRRFMMYTHARARPCEVYTSISSRR